MPFPLPVSGFVDVKVERKRYGSKVLVYLYRKKPRGWRTIYFLHVPLDLV